MSPTPRTDIGVDDEPPSTIEVQVTDSHSDFFVRNQAVILVEQTWWSRARPDVERRRLCTRGYHQAVPRQLLADSAMARSYMKIVHEQADPVLRPWRYFWPTPWPKVDAFPTIMRTARWLKGHWDEWRT